MSHSHTSEILYRLFAPLMAVFVIVGGIQLTTIALGGESQIGAPALVPMPMKKPADNRVSLPAKRPVFKKTEGNTSYRPIKISALLKWPHNREKKITLHYTGKKQGQKTKTSQRGKEIIFPEYDRKIGYGDNDYETLQISAKSLNKYNKFQLSFKWLKESDVSRTKPGQASHEIKWKFSCSENEVSIVDRRMFSKKPSSTGALTNEGRGNDILKPGKLYLLNEVDEKYYILCGKQSKGATSKEAKKQVCINNATKKQWSGTVFKSKLGCTCKDPSKTYSATKGCSIKKGGSAKDTDNAGRKWDGRPCDPKNGAPDTKNKTHVLKDGACVKKEAPKPKETKKPDTCTSFSKDKPRPTHCEEQAPKPLKKDIVKDCIKDGGKVVNNSKGVVGCSFTKVIKGPPKKVTPQQVCERNNAIYRGINQQTGKIMCQRRREPQPPQKKVTVRERCESIGGIYKGVNPQTGRHVCVPRQGGASAGSSKEKALAAQLKKSQAARKADNARANAALKKQAAQARAAQQQAQKKQAQRPPQQRPPQQRPPQKRPQESKGAFDKILAYLKGKIKREEGPVFGDITAKPQCLSFTADDLSIAAGDKVTLQWAVTGADKIIITPKVKIVEKDGKKVAEAHPESSIKKTLSDGRTVGYLLISTNNKGEEHRCYTKPIIVDNDTDPEGSVQCEGAIDSLSIKTDPRSVTRPACDPEQSGEECNNDWQGKEITINWNVTPTQCVTSCKVQLKANGEADWLDVWTTPSDMKNVVDSTLDGFSNNGLLRETSTFKLKCEDGFGNLKEKSIEAEVLIDGRIEA